MSRLGVAVLLSLGLALTASACGMNVQTLKPYTPSEGVNFDAGPIDMRNVMVLSRAAGTGFLSASMISSERDSLVKVTGTATKVDGSPGSPLTVTIATPVTIGTSMVILTNGPRITVTGADLQPGLVANMTFEFGTAGQVTINVPVVDANQQPYATVSPSAASSTPTS